MTEKTKCPICKAILDELETNFGMDDARGQAIPLNEDALLNLYCPFCNAELLKYPLKISSLSIEVYK